jgi:hypothetical protein
MALFLDPVRFWGSRQDKVRKNALGATNRLLASFPKDFCQLCRYRGLKPIVGRDAIPLDMKSEGAVKVPQLCESGSVDSRRRREVIGWRDVA